MDIKAAMPTPLQELIKHGMWKGSKLFDVNPKFSKISPKVIMQIWAPGKCPSCLATYAKPGARTKASRG
jgi:hypothetical protein